MRHWVLGVVAVACLAGAGCSKSGNAQGKAPDKPVQLAPEAKKGNSAPPVTDSVGG